MSAATDLSAASVPAETLVPLGVPVTRYTERLGEAGAVASAGSRSDSYDNAAAESSIGLFETELIRKRAHGASDWFNHRRGTRTAEMSEEPSLP